MMSEREQVGNAYKCMDVKCFINMSARHAFLSFKLFIKTSGFAEYKKILYLYTPKLFVILKRNGDFLTFFLKQNLADLKIGFF